jgi:hypothetical protein
MKILILLASVVLFSVSAFRGAGYSTRLERLNFGEMPDMPPHQNVALRSTGIHTTFLYLKIYKA